MTWDEGNRSKMYCWIMILLSDRGILKDKRMRLGNAGEVASSAAELPTPAMCHALGEKQCSPISTEIESKNRTKVSNLTYKTKIINPPKGEYKC
jgi:hypothetical protein